MYQIVYAILNEIKIQHRRSPLVEPTRGKVLALLEISLWATKLAMEVNGSDRDVEKIAREEFEKAIRGYDWGIE